MPQGKLVELENVNVLLDGRRVLKSINFSVSRGDRVIILGPNGSGKTTLIRTMLYLVKPSSGKVVWHVNDGVMANLEELFGALHVPSREMLRFLKDCLEFCDSNLMMSMLEKFNISNRDLELSISKLSTGQKKIILNTVAIACGVNVTILDEPFEGLDPYRKSVLLEVLQELDQDRGIIVVTHETALLKMLRDWKVYLMVSGSLYGPVPVQDLLEAGIVYGKRDNAILQLKIDDKIVSIVKGEGHPIQSLTTLDELYAILVAQRAQKQELAPLR